MKNKCWGQGESDLMLNVEVMNLIWSDTKCNGENNMHIKITACENIGYLRQKIEYINCFSITVLIIYIQRVNSFLY